VISSSISGAGSGTKVGFVFHQPDSSGHGLGDLSPDPLMNHFAVWIHATRRDFRAAEAVAQSAQDLPGQPGRHLPEE
jgi:hypothetical protein